jgi:hypothetical protein
MSGRDNAFYFFPGVYTLEDWINEEDSQRKPSSLPAPTAAKTPGSLEHVVERVQTSESISPELAERIASFLIPLPQLKAAKAPEEETVVMMQGSKTLLRSLRSVTEPKRAPGAETEKGRNDSYTVVWHWGYPKDAHLPDSNIYTPGPEWYIFHPATLNEARSIYDSINSRLGHHENRASRAIFSPEGNIVDTWAFDQKWVENLKKFDQLRKKGWQPHEEDGIWH